MGQKWTSGILPIEIWHITDNRDCLASHRAVHCAERTWEEIPLLAWAQASEQAPHVRSPSFVTGRCTVFCCWVFTTPPGSKRRCQEGSWGEILTYFYIWHHCACQEQVDCEQTFGGASTLTGTENPGVAKQAKSSIANSQRLNCPPLLLPFLGNANFSGRKGVEVASSVHFCVCLLVFHLFLLLVLRSAALGGVWRINLLSLVAWTSLS